MTERKIVRVGDVMKRKFDLLDGTLTGLVLISDIAKKVLAADRSPDRVNLYEIMAKPVLAVSPEMNIRYCARLLERFGIMRAPVISNGQVVGIVSFHDLVLQGLMELIKED
jgi:CBS domain-containing protein